MTNIRGPGRLLIVSSSEKSCRAIAELTDPDLVQPIRQEKTGAGARQCLLSRRFDVVIINTPLSDEYGHELAAAIARQSLSGVILLVKADVYEEVCDRVAGSGVLTVSKPLSGPLFHQAMRLALAGAERLAVQAREMERLKEKLEESRLVGRAKCVLIEQRKLSEAEAHRLIEKQAMDRRIPRRDVAEEILRLYEE